MVLGDMAGQLIETCGLIEAWRQGSSHLPGVLLNTPCPRLLLSRRFSRDGHRETTLDEKIAGESSPDAATPRSIATPSNLPPPANRSRPPARSCAAAASRPARIGTSSPDLGVPVIFAEIAAFRAIVEYADAVHVMFVRALPHVASNAAASSRPAGSQCQGRRRPLRHRYPSRHARRARHNLQLPL